MKSLGFDINPKDILSEKGQKRAVISLTVPNPETIKTLPLEIIQTLRLKREELENEIKFLEGTPSIGAAIREIRKHHSLIETREGIQTALSLVENILKSPKDIRVYRVKKSNPLFFRSLGHLQGSEILMNSIGFISSQDKEDNNGAIYILQSLGSTESFNALQQTTNTSTQGIFYFF